MSKPSYGHKALYVLSCFVTIVMALYLGMGLITSGLRIIMFGTNLVLMPVLCLAVVYIVWHAKKFFK
jgi:hypothetical protein